MTQGEGGPRDQEKIDIKQVGEIEKIWAELIEKGGDMDANKKAAARALLYTQLQIIGILNFAGYIDVSAWSDLITQVAQRKTTPIKPDNYPEFDAFKGKFEEYEKEVGALDTLKRHSTDLPRYLYGLGMIILDRVVYETIFENDDIQIKDSQITVGKHREAALGILAKFGYSKPSWVRFATENK